MTTTRTPVLRPVGAHTGTMAVCTGLGPAAPVVGTVYPLYLRGVAPGPVAYVAHWRGLYVGHERTRAAAVRAIVAACG